jgi:hypothetical protein
MSNITRIDVCASHVLGSVIFLDFRRSLEDLPRCFLAGSDTSDAHKQVNELRLF